MDTRRMRYASRPIKTNQKLRLSLRGRGLAVSLLSRLAADTKLRPQNRPARTRCPSSTHRRPQLLARLPLHFGQLGYSIQTRNEVPQRITYRPWQVLRSNPPGRCEPPACALLLRTHTSRIPDTPQEVLTSRLRLAFQHRNRHTSTPFTSISLRYGTWLNYGDRRQGTSVSVRTHGDLWHMANYGHRGQGTSVSTRQRPSLGASRLPPMGERSPEPAHRRKLG